MFSDMFFVKDFHRGFEHLLKQNVTPIYNYEFKFDGEINAIKNVVLKTKPSLRQYLKGIIFKNYNYSYCTTYYNYFGSYDILYEKNIRVGG